MQNTIKNTMIFIPFTIKLKIKFNAYFKKNMKQKFLYSLAIAAVFAFPMDSARKRQRTEDFNSVDNTKSSIDFNQLLTLKLWEKPKKYVYLQPSDETETNRDDFKEKFTVDSEIFNQLPLIKNLLADDEENNVLHDSEQTTAHEVRLLNVKSDILTALLNFASWISTNQIEFKYL